MNWLRGGGGPIWAMPRVSHLESVGKAFCAVKEDDRVIRKPPWAVDPTKGKTSEVPGWKVALGYLVVHTQHLARTGQQVRHL